MNALTHLYALVLRSLDVLLGWLLWGPRDLALLLFAAGTALLTVLARRAFTNQDLLRRCADDLPKLNQFLREAQQTPDKPLERQRFRSTIAIIKGMQFAADLKVLAVVIVPVAALACWATERFDYFPPRVGDEITLRAVFPISSVDHVTHLVPIHGIELRSPAIQRIQSNPQSPSSSFVEWRLHFSSEVGELPLTIRHRGETAVERVAIGRSTYLPPQQDHPNEWLQHTEIDLVRYRPLGIPVKTEAIGLPPWMIGYMLLTLLLVPLFKRVWRVF